MLLHPSTFQLKWIICAVLPTSGSSPISGIKVSRSSAKTTHGIRVTTGNLAFYRWGPNQSIIRRLTKLRTLGWELFTGRKFGEAGPWGEKTSGTWHSVAHARLVWRQLCDVDEQLGTRGVGWCFDIHAKK